nr:RDD family protein [Mycobacterium sp. QGD 101]
MRLTLALGVGGVIGQIATNSSNGESLLAIALILALACYPLALAFCVWNWGYRQGRTGSSVGKSVLKFKVVGEKTWEPIGFENSLVRQVVHFFIDTAFYIGFLWPLWDSKRQTFADKIMDTVCVPSDRAFASGEQVAGGLQAVEHAGRDRGDEVGDADGSQ